jgi:hypothetical protein
MTEDSHYFDWEPDPDPHRSEQPDLDSDLHQIEETDPDPYVEVASTYRYLHI